MHRRALEADERLAELLARRRGRRSPRPPARRRRPRAGADDAPRRRPASRPPGDGAAGRTAAPDCPRHRGRRPRGDGRAPASPPSRSAPRRPLRPASARAFATAWPSRSSRKARQSPSRSVASVTPAAIACPPPLIATPGFDRRPHHPAEIDARDRAAGAGRVAPGEAQREGRALEPLLEPRREQADDARRPGRSRDHDRRAALLEAQREQRFRLGLGQRLDLDLLADAVQPVELDRDRRAPRCRRSRSGAARRAPRRRCVRPH